MPEGEKDEEKTEETTTTDDSEQEAVTEVQEEKEEEGKTEEEKTEEAAEVEVPELTDEQAAALRERDERFKPEAKAPDDLNALIGELLDKKERAKETEQATAAERKTLEEAEKAFEDGDPVPLAQIAVEQLKQARARAAVTAQLDEAMTEELKPYVEATYGDLIRAMKPEEVDKLSEMPLVDALTELDRLKAEGIRGEATGEVDAAKKAAQHAKTAVDARSDATGTLPGGSAKEEVGESIGDLMRQGMEEALDVEEAQGG